MTEEDKKLIVARLLERVDASTGFAGLGQSVQLVCKITEAEEVGIKELTAVILCDAGLTTKLLRFANSSRHARGAGNISTIDQAIALLGLNTIRTVVLSLALLNGLSRKPQSSQLHAEIVAAFLCGTLAAEFTRVYGSRFSSQEAQISGLLQNLGRMMVLYHLYESIEQVRQTQAEKNLTEEDAVQAVLGVSFEEMSAAVAGHWTLPDVLQQSLIPRTEKAPPREARSSIEWHQLCAQFSRRITDALFRLPEGQERTALAHEIEYFRSALKLRENETHEIIVRALETTETMLTEMMFPSNVPQARALLRKGSERVRDMLSDGDVLTRSKDGGRTPMEVIHQVLRQIHNKYEFDRTLLCLPDSAGINAVAGVGRNAAQITLRFKCNGHKQDVFRAIAAKKKDFFISNAHASSLVALIPEWYRENVNSQAFLLICLVHQDQLLGLIYGDYATTPGMPPQELTEGEMVVWRQQLIQALLEGSVK